MEIHRLFISGPKLSRDRFRAAVEAEGSILQAFFPIPASILAGGVNHLNLYVQDFYGTCRLDRNPYFEADTGTAGVTVVCFDLGQRHAFPPAGFLRVFAACPDLRFAFEYVPEEETAEDQGTETV